MTRKIQPWINIGYRTFAQEGTAGLKVERLARQLNKNKSSFYHYFADVEGYQAALLDWHVTRCGIIAQEEKDCETLEEILAIFLAFKEDLLFHRQLRVHRAIPVFEACLDQTMTLLTPAFLPLWMKLLDLPSQSYLAEMVLKLSVDNFFLQITPENFHASWLNNYFKTLIVTLRALRESYPMNESRNRSLQS